MLSHETSPIWIFTIFLFVIVLAGCAITKPSKNSFQATIQVSEWDFKADQSGEFYEMEDKCMPGPIKDQNAFVLIHGIYGDEDTFDRLQEELTFDSDLTKLGSSSVYLMEYWSSRFFPNFQSLSELGQAFKSRVEELVDCKNPKTLIIIAHSQGGLIAKEAVLSWKEKGDDKGILEKTKLVLIGTPNSFSTFAAYNNLFVNSLFAPLTYVTGIFSAPFGKALVYNRQAFDLADSILPYSQKDRPGLNRSKFMLNHIAKWGEYFPKGVIDQPKTYAIVGIRSLFNEFALSDGIVHSDTLLFAGIPAQRVRYVPYRHFDDVAAVDNEHHRTFKVIKDIVLGKLDEAEEGANNADKFAQRLSPFKDLSYSLVTFVMKQRLLTDLGENAEGPVKVKFLSIDLDGEKPFLEGEYEDLKKRVKSDFLITSLGLIGELVLLPFQTLLNFAYPATHMEDYVQRVKSGDMEPKWRIMRLPEIVLDGPHKGTIYLSRKSNKKSWFFGMSKDENGIVKYAITDKQTSASNENCAWEYPIQWEFQMNSRPSNNVRKITLQPNAVNYIKVELNHEAVKLTRVGCG
jgi:triacylglycerol esterase/lipase EstA (alpha/beta hydrolase family)